MTTRQALSNCVLVAPTAKTITRTYYLADRIIDIAELQTKFQNGKTLKNPYHGKCIASLWSLLGMPIYLELMRSAEIYSEAAYIDSSPRTLDLPKIVVAAIAIESDCTSIHLYLIKGATSNRSNPIGGWGN